MWECSTPEHRHPKSALHYKSSSFLLIRHRLFIVIFIIPFFITLFKMYIVLLFSVKAAKQKTLLPFIELTGSPSSSQSYYGDTTLYFPNKGKFVSKMTQYNKRITRCRYNQKQRITCFLQISIFPLLSKTDCSREKRVRLSLIHI